MASLSQGSPSPPPPLDTALLPAKRKIACLACRTIKLRCLFAGPDAAPLDPCRRCKRLDIACVYQPKRRPVKPSTGTAQASSNSADTTGKPLVVDGGGEDETESRRTRSPYDAVDSIHPSYTNPMYPHQQQQQQQGHPRMPYGANQADHLYPEHPSKRRRVPGSGSGQPGAGEGYAEFEASFSGPSGDRGDAYGYDGYGVYSGALGRQIGQNFPAGHTGAERPGTGMSDVHPHQDNSGTEIDQKVSLPLDSGNPGFVLDPAFSSSRSREPPTSYGQNDAQRQQQQQQQQQHEQRDWAAMYGNVGAVQQNQIHLSQPSFQSVPTLPSQTAHRGSIQNARASVSRPTMGQHQNNLHVRDHGNLPVGHIVSNATGEAVMTPGSHEGSIGTAGTAPGTAGTISSAGGMAGGPYRPTTGTSQQSTSRPKSKILYTQPLSISPSSMGAGGMGSGSGFHTSSERSTRNISGGGEHTHGHHQGGGGHAYSNLAPHHHHHHHPPHQPQHTPLQVAHPQTAPAYREYGSYLSYERDVHDVGAGPIAASDSGSDDAKRATTQMDTTSDGARRVKGEHGEAYGADDDEGRGGGDAHDNPSTDQPAMRNSMALTSILDDMKKDLRAPTTSSERDRHHHHHHHHPQHTHHPNTEGKMERETSQQLQSIQPHSADYVTQEGPTGADPGREMDIGERYNAMDIAERERKLASVLDIGSGGIGGGGPISINLDLQTSSDGQPGTNTSSYQRGPEKGTQSGQHLMVPPQQQHSQQPSALVSTNTKRSIRGRVGIVDDENRMRQREREHQRLERERMEGMEDPVTLGILDQDDVAFLFECFHDKFNAYIAILDPALHTPNYVLKTCSLLHTAVCTVTAQTYAPEQYKVLLKRVNFMLGKAFERGDQHIGIVQALSILSCWKEPHDKGGWLRLGYAIRMGYELGLDQPPQRPLPKDKLKAFEVLNRERTWFQLAAFDRSMHSIFGRRQRMIRTETQHWIEDWITDHPEVYCYADGMLAASYPTGEMIINLRQSTPSYMEDDVGFRVMLHRTRTDIASWRERWFGEQPLAFLHPISAAIIGFYAVASDWEVADFCYRNVPKSRIPEHLADATSKAMKLLKYIVTDLAPGEIMVFAPDVITVRAARSAVFLARLIPQLDPTVVEEIYNIFRDVVRECRRHSRGQNTTYHLAKFFASLIKISSVGPTRSASRLQTPDEGSQEPEATAVSGEALTAKLNEAAEGTSGNQDPVPQDFFQNDESLFVFDDSVDPLSIDALLQESQDWFSADLMAQINSDGGWNPLPTFPLPDFQML